MGGLEYGVVGMGLELDCGGDGRGVMGGWGGDVDVDGGGVGGLRGWVHLVGFVWDTSGVT